jgi:putative polyketide hydroxylase
MIVLFQADLARYVGGREFFLCFVSNSDVHGVLGQLGATGDGRWCLAVSLDADAGHEDYTEQQCADLVRAAVGVPDLAVKIEDVDSWEIAARIADEFRSGRVFLAGDAAHVMPPTGGFGGNMGIQDAHNLAWKLALVLQGLAGEELLATYQAERAPVAEFTVDQGVIRYLLRSGLDEESKRRHRPEATVLFGHCYADGTVEDPTRPSARPGTRAPHLPAGDGDVHDLMRGRFVLLATPGARWPDAAAEAAARLDLPIDAHELDGDFQRRYGVEAGGAVLVRPDGFVAWRTSQLPDDPASALVDVLGQLLHLPVWVG